MLLYRILLIVQLVQLSHQISCYECPTAPTEFIGLIDAENLPHEILNCSLAINKMDCSIEFEWYLTDSKTYIKFSSNDQTQTTSAHTLLTSALQDGYKVTTRNEHRFHYTCMTDACNDADRLKLLLQSLTLVSNFNNLDDILNNDQPFDGNWCSLNANFTDTDCPSLTGIQPSTCLQCVGKYVRENSSYKSCSSCLTSQPEAAVSVERQVMFDMSQRSQSESSLIVCQSPQCNRAENEDLIIKNSDMKFDFTRFLGPPSDNTTVPMISTTSTISSTTNSASPIVTTVGSYFPTIIVSFLLSTFY